jgi:glyoxylase-like metal-dependent hydrolase (beta-lactamase superfamily II)
MDQPTTTSANLSRRSLFTLASAATAAVALDSRVLKADTRAETPKVTESFQGAGVYAFKVGDIKVTLVSDGGFPMDLGGIMPKVAPAEIDQALADSFRAKGPLPAHVNTLLIQTGTQNVLVDVGAGGMFGPTAGKTLTHLARTGVKPADINTIVITHMHGDHFGLLLDAAGFPFPNAQVVVHDTEASFWPTAKSLDASMIPAEGQKQMIDGANAALGIIKKDNRLVVATGEKEVAPGVTLVPAPGHTPGHACVQVASGSQSLLYLADVVHAPAVQFAHPQWQVLFDADNVKAVETRVQILDRVVANKTMVSGSHLPFPALGHIEKRGTGYGFVPAVWEW